MGICINKRHNTCGNVYCVYGVKLHISNDIAVLVSLCRIDRSKVELAVLAKLVSKMFSNMVTFSGAELELTC